MLSYGGNTIELTIDSASAYLNGEAHTLDTTPIIINDRTMLPIRFIAEGFEQEENRMLVVYFSATGNTESLAQTIAEVMGADIYEIVPEEPYTSEDLNYSDDSCRANQEMNDPGARPAIAGSVENMDEYDTILLGYPIWWGTMPRIINTFLDSYDLSGKTIMPFCTSGGTGITTSVSDIRGICTDSEVTDGLRGSASTGQADIEKWLGGV